MQPKSDRKVRRWEMTLAAAWRLEARGEPITHRTLAAETGYSADQVRHHIPFARTRGLWLWELAGQQQRAATNARISAANSGRPKPESDAAFKANVERRKRAELVRCYAEMGCLERPAPPNPPPSIASLVEDDRKRRAKWRRLANARPADFVSNFEHHNARQYRPIGPEADRRNAVMKRIIQDGHAQYRASKASY